MYQVVEINSGRRTLKMVDSLPKCRRRLAELRKSRRGDNVNFLLEKSNLSDKMEYVTDRPQWANYDKRTGPRVTR